jgi:hypothetical protein
MTVVDGIKASMILRRLADEPVAEIVQCSEPIHFDRLPQKSTADRIGKPAFTGLDGFPSLPT